MSAGHGHGDHHGGNKRVALLISLLALVLAFAETLGKSAQTAALASNIEASNLWAFFQAKTIRQTVLRTAAEELQVSEKVTEPAKKQVDKWRDTAQRYQNEPETGEGRDQLAARAKAAEKKRDKSMDSYHNFESAAASAQIAIVLASASIIAEIAALVWIAGALGVIGVFFCVMGFFFPFALHLF
jgi:Domain of unknown function (DUF4337)